MLKAITVRPISSQLHEPLQRHLVTFTSSISKASWLFNGSLKLLLLKINEIFWIFRKVGNGYAFATIFLKFYRYIFSHFTLVELQQKLFASL